ncbi:MAG: O-antigen ligase family protein, partial [Bacteroidota bacterium]
GRISTNRSYHGLLLTLVFGVSLLSGWNSTDTSEWIHILILRLPFVLLPLAFWVMPDQSTDRLVRVHLHLVLVLVVAAIPQLFFFFHHLDTHLDMLSRGQPIATPIEHVKYSMINAYGVISSAYFLSKRASISARLRPYIIGGSLLLFVFMHLLAVRTGLVICYVSIMALFGWQYLKSGSYIRFIALFTGILALAVTAYSVVPSIKHKVHYMLYDWRMWSENGGVSYADSERIISFRAALQVWLDHPWWGVGAGDVRETLLGPDGPLYLLQKLPHNQFLLTLTGSGLIGLLLFTIGFYGLLWSRNMTHRGCSPP